MKNWARIVTIVVCTMVAFETLWELVTHFSITGIPGIAISALIIWYLLKPDVKAAFLS